MSIKELTKQQFEGFEAHYLCTQRICPDPTSSQNNWRSIENIKTRAAVVLVIVLSALLMQACSSQPKVNWDGTWISFVLLDDRTPQCEITVQTSGQEITAPFDCGTYATGTARGTVSSDGLSITGFVDDSLGNKDVDFLWQVKPDNDGQFVGHLRSYGWCGHREGVPLPDPRL